MEQKQIRSFNLSRTNFWISAFFQLIFAIVPFLFILFFLSPDFQQLTINLYDHLPNPKVGYLILICVGYVLVALILTFITWILKWQKADGFTFVLGLTLLLSSVIINQTWLQAWDFNNTIVKLLIRFIIAIMFGLIGIFLGLLLSTLARNFEYKQEDKIQIIIDNYHDQKLGDKNTWTKSIAKIIQNYEKAKIEEKINQEKKNILEQKLATAANTDDLKDQIKKEQIKQKLNLKEEKQRTKKSKI
ncbi:DxFTY motif-containing membrane protein [Williamsoniiplasma luminosum]|uniref:Uncharacterized protein n=1 Tax=Williamsoniiplasma luminosum TaxID=214888 RepID=A0A2S0NJ77_9MOLU|nr:hypothetical protein [Williamsoniiplasma luminosum]AVP49073.1 MAG: hypothetical protein C5T88_00540 [Williamsoniiplasma luminosum]